MHKPMWPGWSIGHCPFFALFPLYFCPSVQARLCKTIDRVVDKMASIETALLYVDHPAPAFGHICDTLNARLGPFGINFAKTGTDSDTNIVLAGSGMQVVISVQDQPLPADGFMHSMESPLSAPFQGVLSEILFRHKSCVLVTVLPDARAEEIPATERLNNLRVAHAVGSLVAQWHKPAAVHWRQSNQLITGVQYQSLSNDVTPWALFAQARVFSTSVAPEGKRRFGVRLDEASEFLGRPILFQACDLDIDQSYALALSFLRHSVDSGEPIPDGHTFGPEGGDVVTVTHRAPSDSQPQGCFELDVIPAQSDTSPGPNSVFRKDRASDTQAPLPADFAHEIANDITAGKRKERTRSLAISYLMLLIIPPVGVFLLVSNLFFGVNGSRTGLIAATSVAITVLIGAYTFLNMQADDIALLDRATTITSGVLSD